MTDELQQLICKICDIPIWDDEYPLSKVDSLARAEIIVTIEDELGVELSHAEIMDLAAYKSNGTLGDFRKLVEKKA